MQLVLGDHTIPILKKWIIQNTDLFDIHPELYDEPSYAIESDVGFLDCKDFLAFLETQNPSVITPENANSLVLLSEEFGVPDLCELAARVASEAARAIDLSERIMKLEHAFLAKDLETESLLRDLAQYLTEFLVEKLSAVSGELSELKVSVETKLSEMSNSIRTVESHALSEVAVVRSSVRGLREALDLQKRQCPLREAKLTGIIGHLTDERGGNVHDRRTVIMSAKSVQNEQHPAQNVVDLGSPLGFCSKNEPGQWICWDFCHRRVRPTQYAIQSGWLKSWVVEGSVDGVNWIEMDRKTDNEDFNQAGRTDIGPVSFTVSTITKCRFIRLTQTDKNHAGNDELCLVAVEFFGSLFE
jgi:hypothetical protein